MFWSAPRRVMWTTRTTTSAIATLLKNLLKEPVLLPGLAPSDLIPAYSGIRAKLTPPGNRGEKRVADFVIQRDPQFPFVVQLIGIESPGLTSAPSIAEHVRDLAVEILG